MVLMGYNIPFPDEFSRDDPHPVRDMPTSARKRAESLLQVRELANECHQQALKDMKRFANRHRREAPILKEGDQVFLSLEHLSTKRASKKIDYLWDGPFEISEAIGTHAYRVKIPTGSGRPPHNVFHISRLRKAEENKENDTSMDDRVATKRIVRTFALTKALPDHYTSRGRLIRSRIYHRQPQKTEKD